MYKPAGSGHGQRRLGSPTDSGCRCSPRSPRGPGSPAHHCLDCHHPPGTCEHQPGDRPQPWSCHTLPPPCHFQPAFRQLLPAHGVTFCAPGNRQRPPCCGPAARAPHSRMSPEELGAPTLWSLEGTLLGFSEGQRCSQLQHVKRRKSKPRPPPLHSAAGLGARGH